MLAAIVFLAYIQIRGALGKTDRRLNSERWKFDALDYYDLDIDWFAFIFVMGFVHSYGIYEIVFNTLASTSSEQRINGEYVGLCVLGVLLFCRIIQMIFLSQLRGQDHKIKDHGHIVWIFNIVVYVVLLAAMCFVTPPSSFVKSQLAIDILMFSMQYVYYVLQKELDKKRDLEKQLQDEDAGNKVRDSHTILAGLALSARSRQARKTEEGQAKDQKDFKIQNDIYSLAFASMIDTTKLEELDSGEDSKRYMSYVSIAQSERHSIFLGALMVVFVQFSMIFLIFGLISAPDFKIRQLDSFLMVIPRLLSSIMMHMNVEPDFRNGLKLMKYAANHPHHFRLSETDRKLGVKVSTRRAFVAFILGFFQSLIAFIVELNVIVYLMSVDNLMDIIMKFVSLSAIVRFDDMYAAALFENKMQKAVGKRLKYTYRRYMAFEQDQIPEDSEALRFSTTINADDAELQAPLVMQKTQSLPIQVDYKKHSCGLKLMRVVQKTFRAFYVSWYYYFMPFFAIVMTFISGYRDNKKEL
jgi:hypothetical protein